MQGVRSTLRMLAARFPQWRLRLKAPPHPFDNRYGVETGGLLAAEKIRSGHRSDAHTTAYYGTHPSSFEGALRHWTAALRGSHEAPEDFTCIDVGCGKGRVLMLASEWPFRSIVGVELSPALVEIARRNLSIWMQTPHRCRAVEVVEGDALAYSLPAEPTLLYLFHPFDEALVRKWSTGLADAARERAAALDVIYMNPEHAGVLEEVCAARVLWAGELPFTAEDRAADAFGATHHRCAIFRLAGPQA